MWLIIIREVKTGRDSPRKEKKTTAPPILPRLIFIPPLIMRPIHPTYNGASSVNECYSVIYDTTSFQREREERGGQRGEKCLLYPSDCLSCSQWGRPPHQDFFTLSWCVYSVMSRSPLHSSRVCSSLVWSTDLDSTFPLRLQLFVFGALWGWNETTPCENSRWQTDETRSRSWQLKDTQGPYALSCVGSALYSNPSLNFSVALVPLPVSFCF